MNLLLVEHLSDIGWHDDKRRSSVNSGTGVLEFELLLAKADRFKLKLPVSLSSDWVVVELASVGRLVDTTESGLSSILLGRSESETKDGLIEELLVEHVVEWRDNVVDRDGIVGETKDTVELTKGKSESWLFGCLGKVLVFDGKITDDDSVLRDKALERSRSVSNGKVSSVGLVGGRSGRVVLGVKLLLALKRGVDFVDLRNKRSKSMR